MQYGSERVLFRGGQGFTSQCGDWGSGLEVEAVQRASIHCLLLALKLAFDVPRWYSATISLVLATIHQRCKLSHCH
jgi:hypothetical protein